MANVAEAVGLDISSTEPLNCNDRQRPMSPMPLAPSSAPPKKKNKKKSWKRSDFIAALALVVSIAVFIDNHINSAAAERTSENALAVAKETDARTVTSDRATFRAMAVWMDQRVERVVESTRNAKSGLEDVGLPTPDALFIEANTKSMAFVQKLADAIAPFDLSNEEIDSLAKGPADVAAIVSECAQQRDQLVADLKNFKGVSPDRMTLDQATTFSVLPSRILHMDQACELASSKLAYWTPPEFKGASRGTLGELADAQAEALQERREIEKAKVCVARGPQMTSSGHVWASCFATMSGDTHFESGHH